MMYIEFDKADLKALCETHRAAQRKWGATVAKKLVQRLNEIASADCLADLFWLPAARCHQLKGKRKHDFAVDLSGGMRLTFRPSGQARDYVKGTEIDRSAVRAVTILGVENYHD